MSTSEASLTSTPDVSTSSTVSSGTSSPTESSSVSSVAAPDPQGQPAGIVSAGTVQDAPTQPTDPFAELPSVDELNAQAAQGVKYAKALAEIRGYAEPLRTQLSEIQERHKIFEGVQDRFQAPEEVQQLVELREAMLGWETANGQLVPSTQKALELIDPARQAYFFADLADAMVTDAKTGQSIRRIDQVIQRMGQDPIARAEIAQSLGLVEPSAVAPQWQATPDQLAVVKEELQDTFKKLPYDEREALATNEPDFINNYLSKQKLQDDLIAEREQRAQDDVQRQQAFQQQLQQESAAAGESYVDNLITTGLTTFHNSVVEQCNFIAKIDPANLPQGMSPEQAATMNTQIDAANKAEAAQITAQIVALINPQTRRYMLPTLKEIGVVDDKFMADLDKAAEAVGNNGRNYGQLLHQNQRTRRDYQPGPDVVPLSNEANRNFKLLTHYANQLKGRLMEKRSQFFAMKATGHNQILNGVATSRPSANGGNYDPTTATAQSNHDPANPWPTRGELERQYG